MQRTAPAILAVILLAAFASRTNAQSTYYWDNNGATAGFGAAGSTWAVPTAANWSTDPTGLTAPGSVTTAAADTLNFGHGGAGLAAGTITVSGVVDAGTLTFGSASGAVTLAGGTITLGGPARIATFNATNTIGSDLAGSAGLTKAGVGTLILNGATANTFTGGLTLNGGTLNLNFANMATPTDLISSTNALTFGGGTLTFTALAGAFVTSQSLGNLTVNAGGGGLLVNPNGGTSTTVALGSLTATASGGSFVVGRAVGAGAGTLDITTTSNIDATGIYGGRVVFANGTAGTGFDWATTVSGGAPYALSAYGAYAALDLTPGTDTANSVVSASQALTGSRTTNTLKFQNPATAQTLDLVAGNTLTLTGGGLLFAGASVAQGPRIANGTITVDNGSGSFDLVVHNFHATNSPLVGSGVVPANNTSINSIIADNGTNSVTLVKNGPGPLFLGGANTFTGGIIVNQGDLLAGVATALNNNAITFNANAVFFTTAATTSNGVITVNNNAQVTFINNNTSFTTAGRVTGSGGINIERGGLGSNSVNLNATTNDFTGPIRYVHSQANQTANVTVNSLADTTIPGTGNITFGAQALNVNGTANSHNFSLGTATVAVTLNNRQFELATLNPIQSINNNGSQAFSINTNLLVSSTTGKALTLGGTGTGLSTFAGVISNNATPTAGTTILALQKAASATTITLASVEGIQVGNAISGTGITAGSTVTAINHFTRVVTLSVASAAAAQNAGIVITTPNVTNSVYLTKSGTGTWALSGANTYTGTTNITAGSLNIQNANALGAIAFGTQVANAATLRLQGGFSYAAEPLTLTPGTGGTAMLFNVSGDNTWNGTIASTTATATNVSRVQSDTGTMTLAGTITVSGSAHQFVLQGNGDTVVTGLITGVGRLTSGNSGTGVKTVSNDLNNFTGAVNVNGGTLAFTSVADAGIVSALGAPAAADATIPVGATTFSGVFRYVGTAPGGHSTNRAINLAGTIAGATIEANGAGPLVFTAAFTATGAGVKTLTLSGANTGANTIGGTIVDNSAVNTTAVVKAGVGAWVLSGIGTYTGGTTVNAGVLSMDALGTPGATTGALAVNNPNTGAGTAVVLNLAIGADTTVGSLSGAIAAPSGGMNTATINNGGAGRIFTVNQSVAATYPGVIAGAGNLTLGSLSTAALTLTGANTYTGGTVVTAGTLAANTPGPDSATGTSAVTVTGGVLRGTGRIAGAITLNGGIVAPGDATNAGVLTTASLPVLMTGGMTFNVAGGLVNSSQLNITGPGTLDLGSALTLAVTPYVGITDPTSFTLISSTGTSVIGSFASFPEGATVFTNSGTGSPYLIFYGTFPGEPGNVVLAASAVPEPAVLLALAGLGLLVRRRTV